MQPDPAMQHFSPYLAMGNNPASFTDPLGLADGDEVVGTRWLKQVTVTAKGPWWFGYFSSEAHGKAGVQDAVWEDQFFNQEQAPIGSYKKRMSINYSQSVMEQYRNIDNYNADKAGLEKVKAAGLNTWDYISNATGALSAHPTIKSTWRYNSSGGNIRWTGKNGNYYIKSELKMNGGYVKSIKFAQNASKNLSRLGNGLTAVSLITSGVSAGIAVSNGKDNTSTWVGLGVGIGGAVLTVVGSPVIVTGAAIVGAAWGVSQLLYGDEINNAIDNTIGYEGGILNQLGLKP